jgi:Ankyrin repeats (many copies)
MTSPSDPHPSKSLLTRRRGELEMWRRVHRHGVPRWMIERATERRLAGDWRGACAAAMIDVEFDLAEVAREAGAATAERLEADLAQLVPDLLCWHLPRVDNFGGVMEHGLTFVLSSYRGGGLTWQLSLSTPDVLEAPQRPRLTFGPAAAGLGPYERMRWFAAERHLWDRRYAHELLRRCGGGDRPPFFLADGIPVDDADPLLAAADAAAVRMERVTRLQDAGRIAEAFEAAGLHPGTEGENGHGQDQPGWLGPYHVALWSVALTVLADTARHRAATGAEGPSFARIAGMTWLGVQASASEPARVRLVDTFSRGRDPAFEQTGNISSMVSRRLPDLDLLRFGYLEPDELHPLVRAALFPALGPPGRLPAPEAPPAPAPVRVRCQGVWHTVQVRDGQLETPAHTIEEARREQVLAALGGQMAGCFAAAAAWRVGRGRLPRALRLQRIALFRLVMRGDTPAVMASLDAGFGASVRLPGRRSLLHYLAWLDHDFLLPRLLASGLSVDDRDHAGRTPLHVAVMVGGSAALVRALLDAGANPRIENHHGHTPADLAEVYGRGRLAFLREGA